MSENNIEIWVTDFSKRETKLLTTWLNSNWKEASDYCNTLNSSSKIKFYYLKDYQVINK